MSAQDKHIFYPTAGSQSCFSSGYVHFLLPVLLNLVFVSYRAWFFMNARRCSFIAFPNSILLLNLFISDVVPSNLGSPVSSDDFHFASQIGIRFLENSSSYLRYFHRDVSVLGCCCHWPVHTKQWHLSFLGGLWNLHTSRHIRLMLLCSLCDTSTTP